MTLMRAVEISAWCEPAQLTVSTVTAPACPEDCVRIRMRATPVSFALSLLIAGRYQRRPTFPFIPGNTVAGEIIEVGAKAGRNLVPGQRVVASLEYGAFAEEVVAPAVNVYPIVDGMSFPEACTLNTSYNSVLAALTWSRLLDLQAGQTLLVTGAAGGVGIAALEIAQALGANVVASASTQAKRDFLKARGAKAVVESEPSALKDAVMHATGGAGVDRVLDPVGGEIFTEALRCLKPEGRILPIGFASGAIPSVPANLILVKNISVVGLYMGYYKIDQRTRFEPDVRDIFQRLGRMFAEGRIRPPIVGTYPLEEVTAAFEKILDRDTIGHVVLTADPE